MHSGVPERVKALGQSSAGLLLRLVFPETCAGCGVSGTWMCATCARGIHVLDTIRPLSGRSVLPNTAEGQPVGDVPTTLVFAHFAFAEPVRRAIHLLKYQGERARSEWFASELLALALQVASDDAVLVPVPLTISRERSRGFNQAAEISERLSRLSGIPVEHVLRRVRETRPQVEVDGPERLENVRGAFLAKTRLDQRSIVLIDDVVTSGATLHACADACYAAGAEAVTAVVVAAGGTYQRQDEVTPWD